MIYQLCISYQSVFLYFLFFLYFFDFFLYILLCVLGVCVTADVGHVASHVYLISGIKSKHTHTHTKKKKKSFLFFLFISILYIRRRKWSDLIGAVPERRLNMIGRPCPSITRQAQHTAGDRTHKKLKKKKKYIYIKNILVVVVVSG